MAQSKSKNRKNGGANLGFEATLWGVADKLRGHIDAPLICHPELVEGSPISRPGSFHRDLALSGTDYNLANKDFEEELAVGKELKLVNILQNWYQKAYAEQAIS